MNNLDNLLSEIESEMTEQELEMARETVEQNKEDDQVRMLWRMYAADPVE